MRKFCLTALTFVTIILTLSSCSGKQSYIEVAEKHGFWQGFGGITWGMTIDECKAVLDKAAISYEQGKIDELKYKDLSEVNALGFDTTLYDTPVRVGMMFIDCAPFELGSEWLYSINVTAAEGSKLPYKVVTAGIKAEFEAIGLGERVKYGELAHAYTLDSFPDSSIKSKALEFFNTIYSDATPDFFEGKIKSPLDSVGIMGDENSDSCGVIYGGMNAALIALAEQGRDL